MSVTVNLLHADYETLLNHLAGAPPGSPQHEVAKTMLEIRNMEAQGKTAERLVASTDELVKATRALAGFTLALVFVTLVLVGVTIWDMLK